MAIGAITMILANVGLQIYNNWYGSRQNAALQQKREEFERAAKDRNKEHMWRLLREGQEMALQLENEKHADRLKELKDEVDHLLEKLIYETTISNWPLKVLPIVMKNQAFGNLLANQEENVAMHVIFTRSNYDKFNKLVYPVVEKQLEQYCDKHWSTMTDHPILFYSGAWKPMVNPTDVQVTAMREELKNLPTLLITPFFRPYDGKLVFQLHMWGVGANSTDKFDVPEIEPTEFQRSFNNQDDYDNEEGLLDEIVEDLVPYLECMIGYMADTYFWSSAGLAPHLPLLLTNGTVNTDGMKYLISDSREYYDGLLEESEEKAKENPFMQANLINLCEGSAELWDEKTKEQKIESCFISFCERRTSKVLFSIEEAACMYCKTMCSYADIDFFTAIKKMIGNRNKQKVIDSLIKSIKYSNPNIEYCFTASQKELQLKVKEYNRQSRKYFIFEIISPNIILGVYSDKISDCKDLDIIVFFCRDSMTMNHGVFVTDIQSFKANACSSNIFSQNLIDKEKIKKYFADINDDFCKYINLYNRLDSDTDIRSFKTQESFLGNKADLICWLRSHLLRSYTGFSLFKGYSLERKKYLLFGVFRKGKDILLEDEVLVSFYDTLPSDIDKLFGNNTHYLLKINYYDKRK